MADQQVSILIDALNRSKRGIEQAIRDLDGLGTAGDRSSRGLGSATTSIGKMDNAASALSGRLKILGSTLIAAFSVERIFALTKHSMEATDAIVDLGEAIGVSADAIKRFVSVGEGGGLTLDQFAVSARTFAAALVAAQDPTTKQARLLRQMEQDSGLAIRGQKDFMDALLNFGSAFSQYAPGVERSALAQEFFGRSSVKMVGVLAKGPDELRKAMGLVSGLTDEQIKASDQWEAATIKWNRLMVELGLKIGTAVTPQLEKFVGWIETGLQDTDRWEAGMHALKETITAISTAFHTVAVVISQCVDALSTFVRIGKTFRLADIETNAKDKLLKWAAGDERWLRMTQRMNEFSRSQSLPQEFNAAGNRIASPGGGAIPDIDKELQAFADRTTARWGQAEQDAKKFVNSLAAISADALGPQGFAGYVMGGGVQGFGLSFGVNSAFQLLQQQANKAAPIDRDPRFDVEQLNILRKNAESDYQGQLLKTRELLEQGVVTRTQAIELDRAAAAAYSDQLVELGQKLEALAKQFPDFPSITAAIPELRRQINELRVVLTSPSVNNWSVQMRLALQDMAEEFALTARKVAQTMKGLVGSAIDTVSNNLTDVIMLTKSWGDALRDISLTIMSSVINAIIKMFAEWIVGRAAAGIASIAWSTKEGAADAAAKAPGALFSSVSSWGVAAAVGAAALIAALASFKAFAAGGPVTGGVHGKDSVLAMLMPGEFVIPKAAVDKYGAAHFEAYRNPGNGSVIPQANNSGFYAIGGMVGNMGLSMGGQAPVVHVVVVDSDQKAAAYIEGVKGEQAVLAHVEKNKFRLGMA